MAESIRKQFCFLFVGGNGCGKTTLILKIIEQYHEQTGKRVLVLDTGGEEKFDFIDEITPDQLRTFTGIKKIYVDNIKLFETIRTTYTETGAKFNGLLILDDARVYLSSRDEPLLRLLRRRRQANADICMIFHGWRGEVPPSVVNFITDIVCFETTTNYTDFLNNLSPEQQEQFKLTIDRVNKLAQKNKYYYEQLHIR